MSQLKRRASVSRARRLATILTCTALSLLGSRSAAAQLVFDHATNAQSLDGLAEFKVRDVEFPLHESVRGWWRLAEVIPKPHYDYDTGRTHWRANLFRRRALPSGALVHRSAYLRGAQYCERLPRDAQRVE